MHSAGPNALPSPPGPLTAAQRKTLLAASLGWMLDSFDVMLYAIVLSDVMRDLNMTKGAAGLLNALTLVASGLGGLIFGFLADRIGRTRALIFSILTYSVCSFASGLSTSILMLAAFRFVLGLGMGGEWNTGATLVAETWPVERRSRALALMQSSWAIGYALAAVVAWLVLKHWDWRAVFFVGVLPALFTLWIRMDVPESQLWLAHRDRVPVAQQQTATLRDLLRDYTRPTIALFLMNLFGMFAWWGLFTWLPGYLKLPVVQGGRGFASGTTTTMLVVLNLVGMFPGYISFGWVAERLGRRRSVILYSVLGAVFVPIYALARDPRALLLLGIPIAFFATGFFSGSGLIGSEVFPTSVRARALGLTYNGARMMSAAAPWTIGLVGERYGLSWAFLLCAVALLLVAVSATQLPETRGKVLE
jgi:MFS family permease